MGKNIKKINEKITKRKVITALFIVIYIAVIKVTMSTNNISSIKVLLTDIDGLEKVCYVIQILTGLCIILSATIAVWQYYLSTKCEIAKQNMEAVQKSIDLAEYYRTNILEKYEIIYYVYYDVGVLDIIKSIKTDQMKEFDVAELRGILSEAQIQKIQNLKNSKELVKALMRVEIDFGIDLGVKEHVKINDKDDEEKLQINTQALLRRFANNIVADVLNSLEYFAMHFEHYTADDTVVYQSLHQTYLELVQMLYCEIALKNMNGHKKYFTNVIGLYNKWYSTYESKKSESTRRDREGITKGTVIKKLN